MGDAPTFSVIIPVYNVAPYLKECIDSVLKQDFSDYEIILINDGSTDGSSEICDRYASENTRVKVFHQENAGVSAARNVGIKAATGKWIMFVDGDDWILPRCFSTLNDKVDNTVNMVFFLCEGDPKRRLKREIFTDSSIGEKDDVCNQLLKPLLGGTERNLKGPVAKLYQRNWLNKSKVFFPLDVQVGEDTIFNVELYLRLERFQVIAHVFYYIRHRESSATVLFRSDWKSVSISSPEVVRLIEESNYAELLCRYKYSFCLQGLWGRICSIYNAKRQDDLKVKHSYCLEAIQLEPYSHAIHQLRLIDVSLRHKPFLLLAKLKSVWGIYMLYRIFMLLQ